MINAYCERCQEVTAQSYDNEHGESYCLVCGRNTIDDVDPTEVTLDFTGFKEAVRAYKLAKSIGMIGLHWVQPCIRCGMICPVNSYSDAPEYKFCDYEAEHPYKLHMFDPEGREFRDDSISPLSCADGQFWGSVDGGYPIIFLDRGGNQFCAKCASDPTVAQLDDDTNRIYCTTTHMEGPPVDCDNCNVPIESAYGDPENPEED